ncbi:hypothetical protein SNE40_011055 [Patella caerulea]|uniref:Uncharacterized protein n=1 Tax=Patella caerulea TaxID=87958 RepID=A0AAN8JVK9_PATCE
MIQIRIIVHICLVCNLVINIKGQEANPCLPEQYYETGLKRCFYCTDLCHKAEARDQLSECQQKCPGYSTSTTILITPTPYESTTYASTTLTISESYESTTSPTTPLNTSRSNESTTQSSPVASGIVQGSVKEHFLGTYM